MLLIVDFLPEKKKPKSAFWKREHLWNNIKSEHVNRRDLLGTNTFPSDPFLAKLCFCCPPPFLLWILFPISCCLFLQMLLHIITQWCESNAGRHLRRPCRLPHGSAIDRFTLTSRRRNPSPSRTTLEMKMIVLSHLSECRRPRDPTVISSNYIYQPTKKAGPVAEGTPR